MIYKLVCAGENSFEKLYQKDNNEIIIAVDGGYKVLEKNNLKINYYFGDFDSLETKDIKCDHIFEYPTIKDKGDLELTIEYLIYNLNVSEKDEIYIYNATGGRLDHYYAILNCLKKYNNYKIYIIDDNNKIYINNGLFNILKSNYKFVSFFSIEENTILSINGCKYNIENYLLKMDDNLCLSNEIIDVCEINTNKNILIIESN